MESVDFELFGNAVRAQYDSMKSGELFTVDVDRDEIWETYLAAFPEGSNPIFRERTEHDCSCCKHFIRNIGATVAIVDNEIVTVWDSIIVGYPYDTVSKAMAEYVRSKAINGLYRTDQDQFGAEITRELLDGETRDWHHFNGLVSDSHKMRKDQIGPFKSDTEARLQVMTRGLDEITSESLGDVVDLINEGALYRGDEHKKAIVQFVDLRQRFEAAGNNKELFYWQNLNDPAARFRNTVIGTLLTDISTGVPLEDAVKMFESKVAPENYKRPKALITEKMIQSALSTIDELGLRDSLERRHAILSDVSVNDVLFVSNSAAPLMRDSLADALMSEVSKTPVTIDDPTDVSIGDFIRDVIPTATSIQLLLENEHVSNLMTLTAPAKESPSLFKWDNGLAWSYNGGVADSSIKQKVRAAGGNVDAVLRVSLAWNNHDDLDLHCHHPRGHINYGNKSGILDVDMNAGSLSDKPVENMQWVKMPIDGEYVFRVKNFSKRQHTNTGFELEFACGSDVRQYKHEADIKDNMIIDGLVVTIKNGGVESIGANPSLIESRSQQDIWGLTTKQLADVSALTLSPNHWQNDAGNKHWFFILEGCKNPDPVRGLYNEYLRNDLNEHRKVFEMVARKTQAPYQDNQMSGLGFSSTKRQSVTALVKGQTNRAYRVNF